MGRDERDYYGKGGRKKAKPWQIGNQRTSGSYRKRPMPIPLRASEQPVVPRPATRGVGAKYFPRVYALIEGSDRYIGSLIGDFVKSKGDIAVINHVKHNLGEAAVSDFPSEVGDRVLAVAAPVTMERMAYQVLKGEPCSAGQLMIGPGGTRHLTGALRDGHGISLRTSLIAGTYCNDTLIVEDLYRTTPNPSHQPTSIRTAEFAATVRTLKGRVFSFHEPLEIDLVTRLTASNVQIDNEVGMHLVIPDKSEVAEIPSDVGTIVMPFTGGFVAEVTTRVILDYRDRHYR